MSRGLFFLAILPLSAQTGSIATVSAASYQTAVAPSSLASIFGSGLATAKASATLDSSGQLPTQLAGTMVEVNGEASSLIYVSPSQINFVIPDDIATGTANIMVLTALGSILKGTVLVGNTAPGVFTLNASGTGPGAILNAVTYASAPFLVETSANSGSDKRTRLSVYATGIRWAGNPSHDPTVTNVASDFSLLAHDSSGNAYTVEFAGAAPGFFGLDQLNIVLPPELDGAGVVSLVVSTNDGGSSNTVTFQVNSLPSGDIHLTGLTLSPTFVTAGGQVQATVTLNGRAPLGGINVSLVSSSGAAQVPFSVIIPQGSASSQFTLTTTAVNSTGTATITAQAAGVLQTAALEIDPASAIELTSFHVGPASTQGGQNLSATAVLSTPSPAGATSIALSSDNPAVKVPATIQVPFGQQQATISIPTAQVLTAQTADLTASFGHTTLTSTVTLNPPFTLILSGNTVTGGNSVGGTVTFFEYPTVASSVTLKSSDAAAQIQPVFIPMSPNQTFASFTVSTIPVNTAKTVSISAVSSLFSGVTQTVALTLSPPAAAQLQSVAIAPQAVTGGQMASGLVTLTAPAPIGGVAVTLKTSDVQEAQLVQQFVEVQSGQTTGSFAITTSAVSSTQTVTITATAAGVSKTAVLTIQ